MDVYVEFIKRMGKNCSVYMAYSIYIPPFMYELIDKEKRKIKEGKKENEIIRIYLTVKDLYKILRDTLEECKHLKPQIYSVVLHEGARLKLNEMMGEDELKKYKELTDRLGEYGEKIGLADLENRKKSFF